MQFIQFEYIIILVLTAFLNYILRRNNTFQKVLLLLVSFYFFAYWDIRFLPLLCGYVLIGWISGEVLVKYRSHVQWKSRITVLSIGLFLFLLGLFKYFNFFLGSLQALFGTENWHFCTLKWILPMGISFYTFQSVSYVVDVSREPGKHVGLLDYALYICFFPKLTAGPLMRMDELSPQLEKPRTVNGDDIYEGIRLFVFGLFKKVFIADRLTEFIARCYENHSVYSGLTLWICAVAYSVQLYCDFSGYSDMAMGSARVLGIRLPENFSWPYLSRNITDFWRRWHISLSHWLRDYLYIPLGGNRRGLLRSYWNQFLTMLLGGLWHGANWTFIVWGAWHGLMLVVHKKYRSFFAKGSVPGKLASFLYTLLTLFCVMLGWIFFRASCLKEGLEFTIRMLTFAEGVHWLNPYFIATILAVVLCHIIQLTPWRKYLECPRGHLKSYVVLWLMLLLTLVFKPQVFAPFVYGQF